MRTWVFTSLMLVGLLFIAGCEVPAQTFWSPDGSKAAYIQPNAPKLLIIDEQGKVLADLGQSFGGAAWSADSKRVYLAQVSEEANAPRLQPNYAWLEDVDQESIDATTRPVAGKAGGTAIGYWEGGKFTPLFSMGPEVVWHMALSPDQNWLAIVSFVGSEKDGDSGDENSHLFVYSIRQKQLYMLSFLATPGPIAFTGPKRLAFVQPERVAHRKISTAGAIAEVDLADQAGMPERTRVAGVLAPMTNWMSAIGEDVYFTAAPITLPTTVEDKDRPASLYRYARAENALKEVVAGVGPFFGPSPDGKLIVFEKVTKAGDDERNELAVAEIATKKVHILGPSRVSATTAGGKKVSGLIALAAWRSNTQISFIAPVGADKPAAVRGDIGFYDLALYELTAGFQLKAIRTLSSDWPVEAKPSLKMDQQTASPVPAPN